VQKEKREEGATKYRLALFDFDGTLADSADWFLQQVNVAAGEMGFRRIEAGDYERVRGYSSQEIIEYLDFPKWKLPILLAHMRKAAAEHKGAIKLFPGVERMFEDLKSAGIKIGIVSSNAEANIRRTLGEETAGHIEVFSCGVSLFGKAVRLRSVLRRNRVDAKSAIYIGDEIRDAVAAREAGIPFGAVAWGFTTIEALRREKPALEFSKMEEVARLLDP
jgi:phosphoglycolate phosphatase